MPTVSRMVIFPKVTFYLSSLNFEPMVTSEFFHYNSTNINAKFCMVRWTLLDHAKTPNCDEIRYGGKLYPGFIHRLFFITEKLLVPAG